MLKASVSIEKNKVVIDDNTIVQTLVSIVDILFVQQRVREEEQNKLINAGNEQNQIVTNLYQQQQRELIGLFSRAEYQPNLDDCMLKQLSGFEVFILNLQNSYRQVQQINIEHEQELNRLYTQNNQYSEEMTWQNALISQLRDQLQTSEQQLQLLNDQLQVQANNFNEQNLNAEKQIKLLQNELNETNMNYQQTLTNYQLLQTELLQTKQNLYEIIESNESQKKQIQQLYIEIDKMQNDYIQLQNENLQLQINVETKQEIAQKLYEYKLKQYLKEMEMIALLCDKQDNEKELGFENIQTSTPCE
ncbi:Hypothetical_protein [Hexamita inflata]|uniref:Hypothetical_protein n=1 Tax=Hexamita inflata TaxID=28002 RepID=A0AA86PLI6_9EUKA|nr:Hypothetical protein HINF_LOCUS29930 [Hexamita inflata]